MREPTQTHTGRTEVVFAQAPACGSDMRGRGILRAFREKKRDLTAKIVRNYGMGSNHMIVYNIQRWAHALRRMRFRCALLRLQSMPPPPLWLAARLRDAAGGASLMTCFGG